MEKISIKNRSGLHIVVLLEKNENSKGIVFIVHGLGGNKEQPQISAFAEVFAKKNYIVVRFDTTNTFGESDGKYEDATVTNYLEDLEDVIAWAKGQSWYSEPFYLVGHSLGGMAAILYAEKHPNEIQGLAPISTVVSGKLSLETPKYRNCAQEWEKTGWKEEKSTSSPNRMKRLPWFHMVDRLQYDVLPSAHKLTMPVLFIVGEKDTSTPIKDQKLLYEKVVGKKEIHIIAEAPHSFTKPPHLLEIQKIIDEWVNSIN